MAWSQSHFSTEKIPEVKGLEAAIPFVLVGMLLKTAPIFRRFSSINFSVVALVRRVVAAAAWHERGSPTGAELTPSTVAYFMQKFRAQLDSANGG